ncbi:21 kDa protein-like [Juglans microcarpa x Juglans regia]|uniref:21 kDa protein-like n=1 Tax=Juglans microcarpa x Juglans regia TaxID=2249226 RepID=UPI001B7E7840|nr:21 kDa protein-like [Juglans microcarpa x Juglans regia]XP_041007857.1 21 kDa protein-like [Juglans microcarpa x Juglans regia]
MEGSSSKYLITFLLILVAISSACINSGMAAKANRLSTEFIRTSCRSTIYPSLCFSSLSVHANSIQTSPQLLASTALNVTLSSAQSTSRLMVRLSKTRGMSPRVVSAITDCVEELSDSVDELRNSIAEMSSLKSSNFNLMINDIQTWVSAALTDESTCTDGFHGKSMNGNVKTTVREKIVKVAQLTSNALALINQYAAFHG